MNTWYTQHIEPTERSLLHRPLSLQQMRETIEKAGAMGALQGLQVSAIVYGPLQRHRVCRGLYPGVPVYLPDLCSTFPGTPQKDLKHDINNKAWRWVGGGERKNKYMEEKQPMDQRRNQKVS